MLHVRSFSPVEEPTMTSADFWALIPAPLDAGSTWQTPRSPRVMHTHLPPYARRMYVRACRTGIGLRRYAPSHPTRPPQMRFLFVEPGFCLRLPSDSTSRWTPLPSG